VFWVAVIPAFAAFALLLFAVKEPERPVELRRVRSPLSRAELARLGSVYWWVVAIGGVLTLARFSEAFLVLRAQSVGLPIAWVATVLVVMNVVYALAAYPAGVLSDKVGRVTVLGLGLVVLMVADVVLALAGNTTIVMGGVVLWGLHMGLTQGLLAALLADAAPPELRGTAFGAFNLITGVALLVASVIAGGLWDMAGPQATFFAGAVFTALALAGLISVRGRLRERPAQ
jgi:MFS family permease